MSWIDITVVVILVLSTAIAIFRGFVKEAVSLATWVAAIWLGILFSDEVALLLPNALNEGKFQFGGIGLGDSNVRIGIAFILIAIGVLIMGALINYVLSYLMKLEMLRSIDRFLGVFFGLARGAVIIVILIMAASFTTFPRSDTWHQAKLLPPFERGARWIIAILRPQYAKHFILYEPVSEAGSYQS